MTKWGVRLISVLFFLWAANNIVRLITGDHPPHGFLFLYVETSGIDLTAWIKYILVALIGFQLWRFNSSGRTWALVFLGIPSIACGVFFAASLVSFVSPVVLNHLSSSIRIEYWITPIPPTLDSSVNLFLASGVLFLSFLAPFTFLLRKDTKALFQKPAATGETSLSPVDAKEQSS